jgi:hypothetical protein
MGYYNVIRPNVVVGQLHYVHPTTQPIEVDDDVAAPLVEAGDLEPYGPKPELAPVQWERSPEEVALGKGLAELVELADSPAATRKSRTSRPKA